MALEELAKDKEGHYFLAALRDIISTFISYRATDTPPFVTHCLQGVRPFLSPSSLHLGPLDCPIGGQNGFAGHS